MLIRRFRLVKIHVHNRAGRHWSMVLIVMVPLTTLMIMIMIVIMVVVMIVILAF
jgi:hypothetical protein